MSQAPTTPEPFFSLYLPERVARLAPALGGRDSAGSVAFRVLGAGEWFLRLHAGKLEVSTSELPDKLLSIVLGQGDFAAIMAAGADRVSEGLPLERQLIAARVLTVNDESARLVRAVRGNLGLVLSDGDTERRLLIAPAAAGLDPAHPDCEIACSIEDFWAMQSGAQNPFELLMNGRLRLGGDAQIAMALAGVFA